MRLDQSCCRLVAVTLSLLLLAGSGCKEQPTRTPQEREIRVGSILPLTGPAADFGRDIRRAQELAAEYFNSQPEVEWRVTVAFQDSKSNPADGTRALHSLLARGYRLFTIPTTPVAMAARPIVVENNVLAFLDASHPAITSPPNPLIFRHSQTAGSEAAALLSAALGDPDIRRLMIFFLNDDYGRAFVNAVKGNAQLDVPISEHAYETTTTDFRTLVQSSRLTDNGTVVLAVGVGRPLGLLIRSIREQGYSGPVYTTLAYRATGAAEVLGGDRAGIVYTDLSARESDATRWLAHEYHARHGAEPQAVAVMEFQNIILLAMAASAADSPEPSVVANEARRLASQVIGVAPTASNDLFPLIVLVIEDANGPG